MAVLGCFLASLLLLVGLGGTGAGPGTRGRAFAPAVDVAKLLSNYRLAAGDVITIRVFGEDDLSREKIRLSDAGTIPTRFWVRSRRWD